MMAVGVMPSHSLGLLGPTFRTSQSQSQTLAPHSHLAPGCPTASMFWGHCFLGGAGHMLLSVPHLSPHSWGPPKAPKLSDPSRGVPK